MGEINRRGQLWRYAETRKIAQFCKNVSSKMILKKILSTFLWQNFFKKIVKKTDSVKKWGMCGWTQSLHPKNPILHKCSVPAFLGSAFGARTLVAYITLKAPESGKWLNTVPIPNDGTYLDNNTLRICVGLRLGGEIYHTHMFVVVGLMFQRMVIMVWVAPSTKAHILDIPS